MLNRRLSRLIGLCSQQKFLFLCMMLLCCVLILPKLFNHPENKNVSKKLGYTDYCEVIHIGLVCGGNNSTALSSTFFKSLLFHRRSPIHFHIIVDDIAHKILDHLFQTWNLPEVQVTFYRDKKYQNLVQWIPNLHYSGVFGLMKVLFPDILRNSIPQIIILDTDLTILTDISELWSLFSKFNSTQAIGAVENLSNWYLVTNPKPWPAFGRGLNSGVMLLDIEKLHQRGWAMLWRTLAAEYLLSHGSITLADQDIYNSVVHNISDLWFQIDCVWNVQLNHYEISRDCFKDIKDIKIIHWNSPDKMQIAGEDIEILRTVTKFYSEFNGNYLREPTFTCDYSTLGKRPIKYRDKYECDKFRDIQSKEWRTHLFITEVSLNPEPYDVTLLTQLSFERFQSLEVLINHWEGPMTVTLYVTDQQLQIIYSKLLLHRKNIAFHIVYKDGDIYPVNYLRNVGLNNVETPFIFLSDVDFIPSVGCYHNIKKHLEQMKMTTETLTALVIPAFETQRYRFAYPKSKQHLVAFLQNGSIMSFRAQDWPQGHGSTNYRKWTLATEPYEVKWSPNYEPYIVTSSKIVKYDRRFVGFGWNKVSHLMELNMLGYEFKVVHNCFIIHIPHSPSPDLELFRTSTNYRRCLRIFRDEFIQELRYKYRKVKVTPKNDWR